MKADALTRDAAASLARSEEFGAEEWTLLLSLSLIWGSSFLWIAISLDSFTSTTVALGRVVLGGLALWLVPAARRPVDRSVWPAILIMGATGVAAPALLFALAQERVESAVAGMMNAATPIAVVIVSIILTRKRIDNRQLLGVAVGFIGVLLLSIPSLAGADANPIGILYLALAVTGYGITYHYIVGPQRIYGSLPIVSRALFVGSILLLPSGILGWGDSAFTLKATVALVILGVLGTGIGRAIDASIVGRAGPTRASIVTYLIPVIAILLGVTIRNESVEPIELAGIATVLIGAYITTRIRSNGRTGRSSGAPHATES